MPAERYFIPAPLIEDESLTLEGAEFHHLAHVMRTAVGDEVELCNGRGELAIGEVVELKKKKSATLRLKTVRFEPSPKTALILAQAMPRLNRLETIIEKGTELGMTELWLFPGERSERKELASSSLERMRSIAIAAMKQCGRLYLPEIRLKPTLKQWKEIPTPAYFGDTNPDAPLFWQAWQPQPASLLFFVGPESGLTEQEEAFLRHAGVQGVKLHSHILRTETASLAALTLAHHRLLLEI